MTRRVHRISCNIANNRGVTQSDTAVTRVGEIRNHLLGTGDGGTEVCLCEWGEGGCNYQNMSRSSNSSQLCSRMLLYRMGRSLRRGAVCRHKWRKRMEEDGERPQGEHRRWWEEHPLPGAEDVVVQDSLRCDSPGRPISDRKKGASCRYAVCEI